MKTFKFTTDSIKYYSEIERLLTSNFDDGWLPLWNYFEMTSILIEGQSLTFLYKDGLNMRKFIHRKWSHIQQAEKNDFGIFSLDSIKIIEKEIHISLNDIFEIQNLLKSDLEIKKLKNIILDGANFKLTDFKTDRRFNWKIDEQMNPNLRRIVNIITKNSIS